MNSQKIDHPAVYTNEGVENELRQGEILSNLKQYTFDPASNGTFVKTIDFCIVLSQDCDLLRDFEQRQGDNPDVLNGVLLYEVELAGVAKNRFNSGLWKPMISNNAERFHFLEEVPSAIDRKGQGLSSLLIDFRRYFTIGSREIERQISLPNGLVRRCRLAMPYREHLQTRAAFYFQRVVLPNPHAS